MSISHRIKKALRGGVSLDLLVLEAFRRQRAAIKQRRERSKIEEIDNSPARLRDDFARFNQTELLNHFRGRKTPSILPENLPEIARLQTELFAAETEGLVRGANRIIEEKSWSLLGFGAIRLDAENVWRRDPLSGIDWGLDYHGDLQLSKSDGSDVRVLWELNRFGHGLTLARAYSLAQDESFAVEFFSQIRDWKEQNPYGRGANWACAMEVALRAINLLAAFEIFRHSSAMDEVALAECLGIFERHGRFIADNSEFTYISTSNHYLTNVAGLLWLGVLLPELERADEWRTFGLREMLREMDKQILADGADYESSTGYHRLVTELFLYSFLLCKKNGIEIPPKYWEKLRSMLEYLRGYLRPDGFAPLIGDADGGQVLPLVKRAADDHAYLLAVGAVLFDEPKFKIADGPIPVEVLWLTGKDGLEKYQAFPAPSPPVSGAFPQTGAYILRETDLYLYFNAQDCGLNGRGSHGHNDKLSVEISAFGSPFIFDAGSYAYNFDLPARHRFRSTAYHSTVQVDDREQNSIEINVPFVIGNEARPFVLNWETNNKRDFVSAGHHGYARLNKSVTHHRSVEFDKIERFWIIEDKLSGDGFHQLQFRFHLAPNLRVETEGENAAALFDAAENQLFIKSFGLSGKPEIEEVWVSRNYGERQKSSSICWTINSKLPVTARFAIVPMRSDESKQAERLKKILEMVSGRK